jgi:hypothetical protein
MPSKSMITGSGRVPPGFEVGGDVLAVAGECLFTSCRIRASGSARTAGEE